MEGNMTGFNGKVAIVTGGGSGLGEAIGKALAKRGAKVGSPTSTSKPPNG